MASDSGNVRFGAAELYLNGIHVGYLSGDVLFSYERSRFALSPSGSGSQNLISIGKASLKAAFAEFLGANLSLALGIGTSVATSTGSLSYNPASYSFATSSTSWQGVKIGAESVGTDTLALRAEHTKEDGKKVVIILYKAVSVSKLNLPFSDRNITTVNVEFVGVQDETRSFGDQIGIIIEEV